MCLAVFVGTLHTLGAAVQQSGADPDAGKSSGAPAITANPGHVTAIRKSLARPSQSEMQYSMELQRQWIPRILNRYSKSRTAIVVTPVPVASRTNVRFSRET